MELKSAVIVLLSLALWPIVGTWSQTPSFRNLPVSERLWTAKLVSGNMGRDINSEFASLEPLCGRRPRNVGATWNTWLTCALQQQKAAHRQVASIHTAPSAQSQVVATVYEGWQFWEYGEDGVPSAAWFIERLEQPNEFQFWPESWFAYDYGLDLGGVQKVGDWMRLTTATPVDGWLQVTSSNPPDRAPYYLYMSPLEGQVVYLADVVAARPDGRREAIKRDSYLITKIVNNVVQFRAEIPSDFACGAPVVDPVPLPPILQAPIAELFDPMGVARFSTAHSKGC